MDQQAAATASGLQGNSQNPQSAPQPTNDGTPLSSVQSVSPSNLLSQPNVRLSNLSNTTATQTATVVKPDTKATPVHKTNPALLIVPLALIILAIVMFWLARQSVNNTTKD